MTSGFANKQGLISQATNISIQKIDGMLPETYSIVSARFLFQDSYRKTRFLEENFLFVDISIKIVFWIFFLSLSNLD